MFKDEEIRRSRKPLKQRRKELQSNVTKAVQNRDFHAARQFMRDAGYEEEDPEMLRISEIERQTFES